MLNLLGECHGLSYDALTAHVAETEQRLENSGRTVLFSDGCNGGYHFLPFIEHLYGCINGKPSGNPKAQR